MKILIFIPLLASVYFSIASNSTLKRVMWPSGVSGGVADYFSIDLFPLNYFEHGGPGRIQNADIFICGNLAALHTIENTLKAENRFKAFILPI
jgi:hypothetical protein